MDRSEMMKQLITLVLAVFLFSVAWPQETEEPADSESQVAEASDETEIEDDSDLDVQGYDDEDEDDFVPTQEVSADQSLAFPVDI
jgi:hypothetical protein